VHFERRARLACACSRSSDSAGRAREAHQPQRPRAALQASTRAAPVPGSTMTASQAPWGPLGGRQERASVAQRVLGVKVRQTAFRAPWLESIFRAFGGPARPEVLAIYVLILLRVKTALRHSIRKDVGAHSRANFMDVLGLCCRWMRWTELAAADRFAPGITS